MRFVFTFLLLIALGGVVLGQNDGFSVIPQPNSVEPGSGSFLLDRNTVIVLAGTTQSKSAKILVNELKHIGLSLKIVTTRPAKNFIEFVPASPQTENQQNGEEAYAIGIEPNKVAIEGSPRGQFYGIQTFLQLLPTSINGNTRIACGKIVDAPRFKYRGMHLDVSRHFQPVAFVKKFIDQMSRYKLNYFHWHLTDDQGWRIEIKRYPKLTEIGSKRAETMKDKNSSPYIGDGIPHGGFYTQDDIREVVAYAAARNVTVVPEIELPGHASAALAAYPQLGCKADHKYAVQTTWGVFKEVFCPTDETFKFLEDVLDDTMSLFPDSPYIHIGGDEVLKDHWKESVFVQELKKRENLRDEHEVQSYFIRRIERYINSKGREMIGWDEILEGGLAPNATVMSWRGTRGGIEAAKSRHDVIMTPMEFAYFDYGQGDPSYEPLTAGNHLPLEKVYSFDPVPRELSSGEAKYVIGGQGNIWTEYIRTAEKVEYMAFPRMPALAEAVWTTKENKNFADFSRRLAGHLPRLDRQQVNYRIPEPLGLHNVVTESERVSVKLTPFPGTRIHYTTDGSTPDERSPIYRKPVNIALKSKEVVTLKTVAINGVGRKSVVYAATLMRDRLIDPVEVKERKPGVRFELVGPDGNVAKTGQRSSIQLTQLDKQIDTAKPYSVSFDGFVSVAADGVYEFQVDSTWGVSLSIGGRKLIDETGSAAKAIRFAVVPLKAGLHRFRYRYNHRGGAGDLTLRMGIKGQGLRRVYGSELFN